MLAVPITSLPLGVHNAELQGTAEDAGLDPEVFRDIHVDVRLDRGEDRVYASFEAHATARLECDRTLKMFDMPLAGSYQVVFLPEDEADEAKDNVRILHPDDEQIDLTDAVRDTLLLAVPQRKLAPGAEEIEIPTRFGEFDDDIADPRWEALRKLRETDQ